MKTSTLFGLASTVFGRRKYKIVFVGIQFAMLAYQMAQKRKKSKRLKK
ncbi:hypothetical protein [Galbibacter mesophilus]|nr:hypothetical protein [Galbibacter mesophilus]MCM5661846.1 hypothetical protein [Galbibacter mesophilus]